MQCCKCEKNLAVVSCAECAKSLGIEEGKSAKMCEECSTSFHEVLGKFSATHNVETLQPENNMREEFDQCLKEYNELKDQQVAAQLKEIDEAMEQVEANCTELQEQVAKNIEQFKLFLDVKLAEYSSSVTITRDHKLDLLTRRKTSIKEERVTPSFDEDETKLADLKKLLDTLKGSPSPSLPPLCGGTSCGFPPELVTLQRATVCMKTAHQADLVAGDTMLATVIGPMGKDGTFWVRMLPDEHATQDIILQNISNSLQVEFSTMSAIPKLSFLQPGDLCAARYSQDQRWYRARVVNTKTRSGKVSVFFLDYGNTEDLPLTSLAPLHDKYQVYPFQMIQCCFSTDTSLTYEREVKWKFTDLTHNRILSATILKCSHTNVYGMLHVVQVLDETGSEPFDIGKTVLVLADKSAERNGGSSIKCRDIRLKNQDLPANFEHIVSTATSSNAIAPDQQPIVLATSIKPLNEETHLEEHEPVTQTQETGGETHLEEHEPVIQTQETGGETHLEEHEPVTQTQETGGEEPVEQDVTTSPDVEVRAESVQQQQEEEEVNETEDLSEVVTEYNDDGEHRPFQKPQARVKPLKIEKESSPPKSDDVSLPVEGAAREKSQEHVLKPDTVLELYVTTGLSPDGSFWAQLPTTSEYDIMVEKLQDIEKDILTPIFFNPGDLCAAIYSEDEYWYRARIEDVNKGVFTVRYLDFGNAEKRENQHLSPLPTQFREVPFQALHCSIAEEDHTSFSQISIDKFNQIVPTDEPISATVVKVQDDLVSVQLQLKIEGAESVDLNWEVCSTDVSKLESMSFTSRKLKSDETLEPLLSLPELSKTTNWADVMDDIESPRNDGYLTLSGVESSSTTTSDHSKTPTPTPTPAHEPTVSKESKKMERQSVSPSGQSDDTRPSSHSRHGPRLDMGVARNRILSSLGPSRKDRSGNRPDQVDSNASRQHQRDPLPSLSSSSRRPRKPFEPDASQVKIYVGNMPLEKTIEEVKELFGQFGEIYGLRYHAEYKDKIFLIMGKSEGFQAIEKLNGYSFSKNGHPLVVQLGHHQRAPVSTQRHMNGPGYSSSPPRQRSPISSSFENVSTSDRMKLFVKNIPPGKTIEDIRELFSKYGKVFSVQQDPQRRHVFYMHTTVDAGNKAISNLHGKAISKSSRPLVVEQTR